MARPKNKIPSYLPHTASGQARVRVNGRDVYLGPYGSPESKQEYARFIAENVGNGKPPTITVPDGERRTIAVLVVKYDDFAQAYYVKNGVPTEEKYAIKAAVAPLVRLYGDTPADEFGPILFADFQLIKLSERPNQAGYANQASDVIPLAFPPASAGRS
jgi:hypothetical protein